MPASHLTLLEKTAARPAPAPVRPRIGEVLQRQGVVTADEVARAVARQRRQRARLGSLLRFETGLSEQQLLAGLEGQWGCKRIDPVSLPPDPALVDRLGVGACLRDLCLPWRNIGAVTVVGAVHPDVFEARRVELEALYGPVMLALVSESDLHECLTRLYGTSLSWKAEARVATAESCRGWRGDRFQLWTGSAALLCVTGLVLFPPVMLGILTCLAALVLVCVSGLKLVAALASYAAPRRREPDKVVELGAAHEAERRPVVSILVPLFEEQRIAERLIRRLSRLSYPPALLDVCLVVESDDAVTQATIERIRLPNWMRTVRVPQGALRTKPRALNYALDFCRGTFIGIYDAEDAPEPDQIDRVVARFAEVPSHVACLQGRLNFYNARRNWITRCFALDYASWFGMILPGLARLNLPVPLGGTTLFFRREALETLGAWDAHNVTEDADLGIRLHRHGFRTELIDTATQEEATFGLWPWTRQRSRWIKGYAMTYATHMRDPVRLWSDLGAASFLAFQVLFLGSLLQVILAPVLWTWWFLWIGQIHPLHGAVPPAFLFGFVGSLLAAEILNICVACAAARRMGRPWLMPWSLTLNPYNMMSTLAGYKALFELIRKPFYWDKTAHGLDETCSRPCEGKQRVTD